MESAAGFQLWTYTVCADDMCPLNQTLDLVFDIFWPSEIQLCSFKVSIKNKLHCHGCGRQPDYPVFTSKLVVGA